MSKRHLYWLSGVLALVGLLAAAYKVLVMGFPLIPDSVTERWDVEARVQFNALGGKTRVSIAVPSSGGSLLLVDEGFVSRGFGLITERDSGNRISSWSRRKTQGRHTLYYRATVQLSENPPLAGAAKPPAVTPSWLEGSALAAAQTLIDSAREQTVDNHSLAQQLLHALSVNAPSEAASQLLGNKPKREQRTQVAQQLLSLAGIPARVAWTLDLSMPRAAVEPQPWLQFFDKDRWHSVNLGNDTEPFPTTSLVLGYGDKLPNHAEGANKLLVSWSVKPNTQPAVDSAITQGNLQHKDLIDFSLFALPLETQQVYQILLLIPIAALLLVILRNVIGIRTFGTFMPILIALAFRETQLVWGIILFSTVVALGLAIRFYLEHLKLLLVPRLAAMLIMVVLLMALISILSHKLGIDRGLSVALFPMVIMTMTIERMSITWDERGAGEAIRQGIGSMLVAVIAYLLMFNPWSEHLAFNFPELMLVLLAATLLLGRYTGYRLLELGRFRVLAQGDR